MGKMTLNFGTLLGYLNGAISKMPDPRQPSNGKHYGLKDFVLAAFSVFFTQCESFLEYQHRMEVEQSESNASRLFGLASVPTVPQIRNVLDEVPSAGLYGVFYAIYIYQALRAGGWLQAYEVLGGHILML